LIGGVVVWLRFLGILGGILTDVGLSHPLLMHLPTMASRLYVAVTGAVLANLALVLQVSPGRAAWGWQVTPAAPFKCAEGTVGCPAYGVPGFDACIADATSYDCTVQAAEAGKTCDVDKIQLVCSHDDGSTFTGSVPHTVACINKGMNNTTTGEALHVKVAATSWSAAPNCNANTTAGTTAAPASDKSADRVNFLSVAPCIVGVSMLFW